MNNAFIKIKNLNHNFNYSNCNKNSLKESIVNFFNRDSNSSEKSKKNSLNNINLNIMSNERVGIKRSIYVYQYL